MMEGGSVRLKLDAKRRPTLPQSILDAAGVAPGDELIAHVEAPGRIVLEGKDAVLARLQAAVITGKRARGNTQSLSEEFLTERTDDDSLTS